MWKVLFCPSKNVFDSRNPQHTLPGVLGGAINLSVLSDVLGLFRWSIVCASQLSHDAIFKQHRLRKAELSPGELGPGLLRCASGLFYDLLGDSSERSWWNSSGFPGRFTIIPNCLGVIGFQFFCNSLYFWPLALWDTFICWFKYWLGWTDLLLVTSKLNSCNSSISSFGFLVFSSAFRMWIQGQFESLNAQNSAA